MRRAVSILIALFLSATPVSAATWYVTESGTGDAPTIEAAIDSAASGDTVLVAAGTYGVSAVDMKPGLVLISESGPYATMLIEGTPDPPYDPVYGGIRGSGDGEVTGFWFEGFSYASIGALSVSGGVSTVTTFNVNHCVFSGNHTGIDCISSNYSRLNVSHCVFTRNQNGMRFDLAPFVFVDNSTFFGNIYGINTEFGGHVELSYSILWDRLRGPVTSLYSVGVDFLSMEDFQAGQGYFVFSEDPQFCGLTVDNVYLQSDSPCAPGNHPWDSSDMRAIGALPVGCSTVKTETTNWGEVKALYRGGSETE